MKESEKTDQYLRSCLRAEEAMEHEGNGDTNNRRALGMVS